MLILCQEFKTQFIFLYNKASKHMLMIFSCAPLKYWRSILILEEKLVLGGFLELLKYCITKKFMGSLSDFGSNFFSLY